MACRPTALFLCADENRERQVMSLVKALAFALGQKIGSASPEEKRVDVTRITDEQGHSSFKSSSGGQKSVLPSNFENPTRFPVAAATFNGLSKEGEGLTGSALWPPDKRVLRLGQSFNPKSCRMFSSRILTKYYAADIDLHACCGGVWRKVGDRAGQIPEAVIFVHFLEKELVFDEAIGKASTASEPFDDGSGDAQRSSHTDVDARWKTVSGSLSFFTAALPQEVKDKEEFTPNVQRVGEIADRNFGEGWLESIGVRVILVILPDDVAESGRFTDAEAEISLKPLQDWAIKNLTDLILVRYSEAEKMLQAHEQQETQTGDEPFSAAPRFRNDVSQTSPRRSALQFWTTDTDDNSGEWDMGWERLVEALQSHIWPGHTLRSEGENLPDERRRRQPFGDYVQSDPGRSQNSRLTGCDRSDAKNSETAETSSEKCHAIVSEQKADRVASERKLPGSSQEKSSTVDDLDEVFKKVRQVRQVGRNLSDGERRELASNAILEVLQKLECEENEGQSTSSSDDECE